MSSLVANAHIDYSGMGSALAARALGYLAANLFGAIAEKMVRHHSEGLLTLAFFLPGVGK
jgi:hypothetical protein